MYLLFARLRMRQMPTLRPDVFIIFLARLRKVNFSRQNEHKLYTLIRLLLAIVVQSLQRMEEKNERCIVEYFHTFLRNLRYLVNFKIIS